MLKKHLKGAPKIYSRFKFGTNSNKSLMDIIKGWENISTKDIAFLSGEVAFHLVTIPESLAVEQLDYVFQEFNKYDLVIDRLIINNVIKDTSSEFLKSKSKQQREYVDIMTNKYNKIKIKEIQLFKSEIKGIKGLEIFCNELFTLS